MIQGSCPHCSNPYSVPDNCAGQVGTCSRCGGQIPIEDPLAIHAQPPPELLQFASGGAQPVGAPVVDDFTKKCPDCAEDVKLAANKCRFCGYRFDQEEEDEDEEFNAPRRSRSRGGRKSSGRHRARRASKGRAPRRSRYSRPVVSNCGWLETMLLCFFLGGFGLHRFYTGHVLIGVLQLFTLGGCYIWAMVDFILILTGSYRDSEGRRLKRGR